MDLVYSSTSFVFAKPSGLGAAFTEVDLSFDPGTVSPFEDERIRDKYCACIIPFYKCVFSIICLRLPFTAFEIEVLQHLSMTHSQLHHSCWVYMRFYQYWCEYANGRPYVLLFLHPSKFLYDLTSQTRCSKLIRLKLIIHGFEPLPELPPFEDKFFLELPPFEDRFFLVAPVSPEAHLAICDIGNEVDNKCVGMFSKY